MPKFRIIKETAPPDSREPNQDREIRVTKMAGGEGNVTSALVTFLTFSNLIHPDGDDLEARLLSQLCITCPPSTLIV